MMKLFSPYSFVVSGLKGSSPTSVYWFHAQPHMRFIDSVPVISNYENRSESFKESAHKIVQELLTEYEIELLKAYVMLEMKWNFSEGKVPIPMFFQSRVIKEYIPFSDGAVEGSIIVLSERENYNLPFPINGFVSSL